MLRRRRDRIVLVAVTAFFITVVGGVLAKLFISDGEINYAVSLFLFTIAGITVLVTAFISALCWIANGD